MKNIQLRVISAALAVAFSSLASVSCEAQGEWHSYSDPSGFKVELPEGWSAQGAKDGHTLMRSENHQSFALVQPFQLGSGEAAETIPPLVTHMSSIFPSAHVVKTRSISKKEAVARVSFRDGYGEGVATVLCYLNDGKGMLYGIGAPINQFKETRSNLIRILRSFEYSAKSEVADGAHRSNGSLSFVKWTEPNENMFSTQVPRGWHTFGGAYRFAPVDLRIQECVGFPDGSIVVQNGSANLTTFAPPGPSSAMRGLRNGQQYNVNGVTYTVLPYMSGENLSKQFTGLKLKKDHPDLQITATKERRDLEETFAQKLRSMGSQSSCSIGETDFTFSERGQSREGACIGTTIKLGQGAIWLAFPSFITAPADQMQTGWKVWEHLIADRQDNPEWTSRQSQITAQFNEFVRANHEAAMQQIHAQYVKALQTLDENFRGIDSIINGVQDVRGGNGITTQGAAGFKLLLATQRWRRDRDEHLQCSWNQLHSSRAILKFA